MSRVVRLGLTGDIDNPVLRVQNGPSIKSSTSKQAKDHVKESETVSLPLSSQQREVTQDIDTQGRSSFITSVEGHRFIGVIAN